MSSLVTFSVDTQHRLPPERVATWPLTRSQRLLLSSVSFALNPLFIVLFLWLPVLDGLSRSYIFCSTGTDCPCDGFTSLAVSRFRKLPNTWARLGLSSAPLKVGGIAQEMWQGLHGTLDFWVALLIAVIESLYRLFGRAPKPEAFPMLSLLVGIANEPQLRNACCVWMKAASVAALSSPTDRRLESYWSRRT